MHPQTLSAAPSQIWPVPLSVSSDTPHRDSAHALAALAPLPAIGTHSETALAFSELQLSPQQPGCTWPHNHRCPSLESLPRPLCPPRHLSPPQLPSYASTSAKSAPLPGWPNRLSVVHFLPPSLAQQTVMTTPWAPTKTAHLLDSLTLPSPTSCSSVVL